MVTRILFVCLGNICRSPMAEGVFRRVAEEQGLIDRFEIDFGGSWRLAHRPGPGPSRPEGGTVPWRGHL